MNRCEGCSLCENAEYWRNRAFEAETRKPDYLSELDWIVRANASLWDDYRRVHIQAQASEQRAIEAEAIANEALRVGLKECSKWRGVAFHAEAQAGQILLKGETATRALRQERERCAKIIRKHTGEVLPSYIVEALEEIECGE